MQNIFEGQRMNTKQLARFLNHRNIMQPVNVDPENPLLIFPFLAFGNALHRNMKLTLFIVTKNRYDAIGRFLFTNMKQ